MLPLVLPQNAAFSSNDDSAAGGPICVLMAPSCCSNVCDDMRLRRMQMHTPNAKNKTPSPAAPPAIAATGSAEDEPLTSAHRKRANVHRV